MEVVFSLWTIFFISVCLWETDLRGCDSEIYSRGRSTCYSEKFLSLVTLCFVVAVHPCMGKIPVYKKNCSLVDRSRHSWIVQIVRLRTKWLWVPIPFLSLKLGACFMSRSFLTFRQTIESRFTLKLVRDMIKTYSHEIFALWFVGFREISLYSWFTCQSSEKKHWLAGILVLGYIFASERLITCAQVFTNALSIDTFKKCFRQKYTLH